MTATPQPDGSLLLTYDGSGFSKGAIAISLVLLITAAYDYFIGTRGDERMIALLASAALTALMALVLLEQSRFRLDPVTRLIEWESRWGFSRRSGLLKFADVQHVSVEVPLGDSGVPSRRIVLHLSDGSLLPVTKGYRPDNGDEILKTADAVRGLLGQPAPSTADSVRALIAQGNTIAAIKVLREREGIGLTEAKQRVEEITNRERS